MSDGEQAGSGTPAAGPGGEGPGATGSLGPKIIGWCGVATVVVGVVGQILGLWKTALGDGSGPSPAPSSSLQSALPAPASHTVATKSGPAGECSASDTHSVVVGFAGAPTRSAAHLTATVTCRVAPTDHLAWVVRKDSGDVTDPQARFILRYELGPAPGQYTYDAVLDTTPPGSTRTVFVVLLDDAAFEAAKASTDPGTNYVRLPSPIAIVSNEVLGHHTGVTPACT